MRMLEGFRGIAGLSQGQGGAAGTEMHATETPCDDDVCFGHGSDTLRLALADWNAVTLEQSGFRARDALDAA
jgi:hypothetical protein